MKKLNTFTVVTLLIAFAATGALAENANTDFDPILDADFIEDSLAGTVEGGRNYVAEMDPILDADFIEFAWVGLPETGRNIEVGFHPILDADFGMGIGVTGGCKAESEVASR